MYDLVINGGTIVDGTGAAPFSADVAVTNGIIVEVGRIDGGAAREVDADGAVVTPGWVDQHTHYDGQATWDDQLEGSASNGVTTAIMGNCGVGFAPVRPGGASELIDLMEGVEGIPGQALQEGVPWGEWESFPQYLAFLGRCRWSLDVGAKISHGPLRYYVMGRRAIEDRNATADDLSTMGRFIMEAVQAGALGVSTSRIQSHRSKSGDCIPGTFAPEVELRAMAEAVAAAGGSLFQAVTAGAAGRYPGLPPEQASFAEELQMFGDISRDAGLTIDFSLLQVRSDPTEYRDLLALTAHLNQSGAQLVPTCSPRALGSLTSLATYHAFARRPTFCELAHLPSAELLAALRRPEVKDAILSEPNLGIKPEGTGENFLPAYREARPKMTFALEEPLDYEPTVDKSLAARAAAEGRDVFEYLYDFLLGDEGHAVAEVFFNNYGDGNLDACREMILDPNTVLGLSDAGAHVDSLCDTSIHTFLLTHWTRDRNRGDRVPIELVVKKATSAVAQQCGLRDRGTIAPGKRADLNVIDLARLSICRPELHRDLPAGGARFLQAARGYVATFVRGVQTRADDEDTGARPGRLVRRT